MEIFLNILFLLIGLVFLVKGADFFVKGASAIAKKMKVPSIIVGLTIVAIGTSLPELAVGIASAIRGNVDLSVGDVVGSNFFNLCIIMGVVACISPIMIKQSSKKIDFPFLMVSTALLLLFSCDKIFTGAEGNIISRVEGVILLFIFIAYIFVNVFNAKREIKFSVINEETKQEEKPKKELKTWQIVLCVVLGLGAVIFGGECVSRTAQFLALKAGMSEALVGITIVALGTSLPELVTAIIAAKKGEPDLAVGNVIGSNIINIVLIIGLTSVITPIAILDAVFIDLIILFAATMIFIFFAFHKMKIGWVKGMILIAIYVGYLAYAIVRNYCF